MANVIKVEDKGLEYFTYSDINSSDLIKADKVSVDSVFQYWEFQIQDKQENIYEWRDHTLLSSANKTQIRDAVISHFENNIYKIPSHAFAEEEKVITSIHEHTYVSADRTIVTGGASEGVGNQIRDNATL